MDHLVNALQKEDGLGVFARRDADELSTPAPIRRRIRLTRQTDAACAGLMGLSLAGNKRTGAPGNDTNRSTQRPRVVESKVDDDSGSETETDDERLQIVEDDATPAELTITSVPKPVSEPPAPTKSIVPVEPQPELINLTDSGLVHWTELPKRRWGQQRALVFQSLLRRITFPRGHHGYHSVSELKRLIKKLEYAVDSLELARFRDVLHLPTVQSVKNRVGPSRYRNRPGILAYCTGLQGALNIVQETYFEDRLQSHIMGHIFEFALPCTPQTAGSAIGFAGTNLISMHVVVQCYKNIAPLATVCKAWKEHVDYTLMRNVGYDTLPKLHVRVLKSLMHTVNLQTDTVRPGPMRNNHHLDEFSTVLSYIGVTERHLESMRTTVRRQIGINSYSMAHLVVQSWAHTYARHHNHMIGPLPANAHYHYWMLYTPFTVPVAIDNMLSLTENGCTTKAWWQHMSAWPLRDMGSIVNHRRRMVLWQCQRIGARVDLAHPTALRYIMFGEDPAGTVPGPPFTRVVDLIQASNGRRLELQRTVCSLLTADEGHLLAPVMHALLGVKTVRNRIYYGWSVHPTSLVGPFVAQQRNRVHPGVAPADQATVIAQHAALRQLMQERVVKSSTFAPKQQ